MIKGPNKHTLSQIKDAIHDGLRAVKNAIDDCRCSRTNSEARHLSISFLPGIHLLGHDMLPTLQVWNYMQAMASVAPGSGLGALQKFPIDFLMEVPFAK